MIALFVHDDAKTDLVTMRNNDPQDAGRIVALLQELEGDPDLLDRLTQHDFGANYSADFHVSRWNAQWNNGRNLWRLKVWDLEDQSVRYRVIYAFEPKKQHYHVLGVVPREFNYDPNNPFSQRIFRAYEEL